MKIAAEDVPALHEGARFYCPSVGEPGMALAQAWTTGVLERKGPVTLVRPETMPPQSRTAALCVIGSGAAFADLPPSGDEFALALRELEHMTEHRLDSVYGLAVATLSAFVPVIAASQLEVPLLDADGMGRAFALIHHTSMHLAGQSPTPLVLRGPTGETVSVRVPTGPRVDTILRSNVDSLGGWAALAGYPGTVAEAMRGAVSGTMSRVLEVGRLLLESTDPDVLLARLAPVIGCRRIGRGRIVELEHLSRPSDVSIPTHPSTVVVDEVGGQGRLLRLELRSEIVAVFANGALAAASPDLITLVDVPRSELSTLDSLEPGDLVDVLVTPADSVWYSARGLAMVGPHTHGIPLDHPSRR